LLRLDGLTHVRGENAPVVYVPQPLGLAHVRTLGAPTITTQLRPSGLVHQRGVSYPILRPVQPSGLSRASQTLVLGMAMESDVGAVLRSSRLHIDPAVETDSARSLSGLRPAREADTAGSVARYKLRSLVAASETDNALPSLKRVISISIVTESDTVLPLTRGSNLLTYPSSAKYPSSSLYPSDA